MQPDRDQFVVAVVRQHTGVTPESVRRLGAFVLNAVYRADEWFVKMPRPQPRSMNGPRSAAPLHAELWALERARAVGVPVPHVEGWGTEPFPYLVMRAAPGAPVWDDGDGVLRQAGAHIRRLHEERIIGAGWVGQASLEAGGAPTAWEHDTWGGFLRQSFGVVESLATKGFLDARDVTAVAHILEQYGPELEPEGGPRLCHGDVHPRHLYAKDGALTAIIDWQDALAADPILDMARLTRYERPSAIRAFLEGYEPSRELAARIPIALPAYRLLWSAWTARFEDDGASDWLSHHIAAIRASLWELS